MELFCFFRCLIAALRASEQGTSGKSEATDEAAFSPGSAPHGKEHCCVGNAGTDGGRLRCWYRVFGESCGCRGSKALFLALRRRMRAVVGALYESRTGEAVEGLNAVRKEGYCEQGTADKLRLSGGKLITSR